MDRRPSVSSSAKVAPIGSESSVSSSDPSHSHHDHTPVSQKNRSVSPEPSPPHSVNSDTKEMDVRSVKVEEKQPHSPLHLDSQSVHEPHTNGNGQPRTAPPGPGAHEKLDRQHELVPDPHELGPSPFMDNVVKTSRYTWYNFLPKNLAEQLGQVSNFYFLCIGILQAIPEISTTRGIPTMYIPLTFILFVSGLRGTFFFGLLVAVFFTTTCCSFLFLSPSLLSRVSPLYLVFSSFSS